MTKGILASNEAEIVYFQLCSSAPKTSARKLKGCIVRTKRGGLIAKTLKQGSWVRASTRLAAKLFRDALATAQIEPDDEVIALYQERLVRAKYLRRDGYDHMVQVSKPGLIGLQIPTDFVVPLIVAQSDGLWRFNAGDAVAARFDNAWHKGTYVRYNEETGMHVVNIGRESDALIDFADVHHFEDAVALGLVSNS
ncbi:MAG: hypothetical protein K2W82_17475 [Candidatus Obscuribacterales bacterium]|nr:hypothetical protein [Candidatus Obscuribacterales bacterium]